MSSSDTSGPRRAAGHGLATVATDSIVLDTWFPRPVLGGLPTGTEAGELAGHAGADPRRGVELTLVSLEIDLDAPPQDTSDAYLRLHVLSHRLALPGTVNLDGIFAHLPNVVFTTAGPIAAGEFALRRPVLQAAGIAVLGLDKFPAMLNYVIPEGVRIADASRVRLGAYLASGTTVMHEGFVNFNAGTLGPSMVEGRISQGVVVGAGSDIGGGASIMGTLSGGGKERITVGERSLLGANSGIGISLGDDCVVEAGLYVTAGTVVTLVSSAGHVGETVKAAELSGQHGLLFRRNSVSGAVEALPRGGHGVELNAQLHA